MARESHKGRVAINCNRALPRDDALLRRLLVLRFTYGERIEPERAREFEERVRPRLCKLRAIGAYVAKRVVEDPSLPKMDQRDLSKCLLAKAYEEVGMWPPSWIGLEYEAEEDVYEDLRERIRSFLVKRINEEYERGIGKVGATLEPEGVGAEELGELRFEARCRAVLENKLLPWAVLRGDEVYFKTSLVDELRP